MDRGLGTPFHQPSCESLRLPPLQFFVEGLQPDHLLKRPVGES